MSQEPKHGDFAKKEGEIILREHEYDGIQEYDQKLPNWWLFTFYGAIVCFVVMWVLTYQTVLFKTPRQSLVAGMQAIQQARSDQLNKTLSRLNNSSLVYTWATNPKLVAEGQTIFMTDCTGCHGTNMMASMKVGGNTIPLPGLPLLDHKWKFGDKPMDIFNLISNGSPPQSQGNNGARMQVWSQQLSPKQIAEVVAFIISKVPEDFKEIPKPE